jgi:predicted 3-demethylubiquinone-9 3-methyltransferase (glyoxalase superfamily)
LRWRRFDVSWQVVQRKIAEMISDPDPAKSNRVMQALLPMKKLGIGAVQRAYDGQ